MQPVDYDKLEEYLRAMAYAGRLELLHMLRRPRALQEIRLAARQVRAGESSDRPISRQAIQGHLEKLLEIGVVVAQDPEGGGSRGREYVANPQRIFQVMEELRQIGTLTDGGPAFRHETIDVDGGREPPVEPGPRLVLVHGLADGKVFPLRRSDLRDGRGWVVGRKAGLHVSLDYDPYVSLENSEIVWAEGGGFQLLDLRSSKNGTVLNWRRLDRGGSAKLRPGDVVGVGRSHLVFQRE